ncbi:TonB-dependent receptor domain-containing protein [Rubrivirga sp.]|uniref:TonB-dependent receptor n=1 Tax=Rubrivirga sp. TaxID=1885344 RepID=UPI003C76A25F
MAFLFVPALAFAQTGTIAGTVVDGDFGGGLPGASVLVTELGTGDAADIDGNYEITGIPAGSYSVRYSFIGYASQLVENVQVTAGQTTAINITLTQGAELEEVIVEAEEIIETNNEVGLLRVRQRAAAVSDAISAEAISQAGAATAADAAERITGASVVGGKFVIVRGLGDRYANTQLNGAALPTADPDRRSVQFDLFPSDFLESITTIKTFTPDQPGDFSGGIVDIRTRSLPAGFTFKLSGSGSVNTAVQFADDFLRADAIDVGYFPNRAGDRAAPDLIVDNDAVPFGSAGNARSEARNPANDAFRAELDGIAKAFDSVAAIDPEGAAPLNQGYALSVGNRFNVGGNPLGFLLGLTYDRGASYYDDGITGRFRTSSIDADGRVGLFPNLLVNDARGSLETSIGGIGNLAYQIGSLNEIGVNGIYSRIGESETRLQTGAYPEQYGLEDESTLFVNRTFSYTEREMASVQPRGRHRVPALGDLEVEWTGTFSRTTQDEPDQQFLPLVREERGVLEDGSPRYLLRPQILGSLSPAIRFFRDLEEDLVSVQGSAALPVQFFGRRGEVKAGGRYNRTDRTVNERRIQYDPFGAIPVGDDNLGDYQAYLADDNVGFIGLDSRDRPIVGTLFADVTLPTNNYQGYLDVPAAFVQAEVPLTTNLRAIGGVRYEGTILNVETGPITEDSTAIGRIDVDDILPALNLVYAIRPDMNVRAAASRTLARPTFREIGPFESVNFALDNPEVGNPTLDRTLITNLDLRWEWFVRPGDLLAASVYYKDLQNPIERVILNLNGLTSFQNVETAEVFGVEIEARTGLGILTQRLENLSLGLNLTFTESSISLSPDELALRRRFNPTAPDTRALQGQSPYIVNANLSYDNARSGTSLGAFFNVFGARLSRVSVAETPDVFEQPRPQLDFIASQQILPQLSLKLTAKNILDTRFREEFDRSGGVTTTVPAGRGFEDFGYTFQEYGLGTSFSIGLSFSPGAGGLASPRVPSPSN